MAPVSGMVLVVPVALPLALVAIGVGSRCRCCDRYCIDHRADGDAAGSVAVVVVAVIDVCNFVAHSCTHSDHRHT